MKFLHPLATRFKNFLAPTKKYICGWQGVYTMENKDTNADYQQVARVSDLSPFYINLLNNGSVPPSPTVTGANYELCTFTEYCSRDFFLGDCTRLFMLLKIKKKLGRYKLADNFWTVFW